MRSAHAQAPAPDPRSPHGRLGVEAARPLGADPLVVVASPDTADAFDGLDGRDPGAAARHRATPSAAPRTALGGADEVLVLSGDTPLLTTELLSATSPDTPRGGGGGDRALVRPRRHPQLRPGRPQRRRRPRRDRRGRRRDPGAARDRRGELVDLRLPGDALWPALERLSRRTPRASYTSPTPCATSSTAARASRCTSPPTRPRPRASTRASSCGRRGRGPARPDQRGATCSPASRSSTRRRPGSSRPSTLEPDAVDPSVHRLRGATAVAAGARVGPHAVAVDAVDRARRARGAVLLPSPRNRARGLTPRQARSSSSRTRRSARARRCHISRTWATPRSASVRTSAPARSPSTSPTRGAKKRTRDRA